MKGKNIKARSEGGTFAIAPGQEEKSKVVYGSRLPQSIADQVEEIAAARGVGRSEIVRDLITIAVELDQTLLEQCPSVEWVNEAIQQRLARRKRK